MFSWLPQSAVSSALNFKLVDLLYSAICLRKVHYSAIQTHLNAKVSNSFFVTGRSLSSIVTVTIKERDDSIVFLCPWVRVSKFNRNLYRNHVQGRNDSFWLYWSRVSMFNRNSNRNVVVMVATESQTIFTWSIAIYKVVNGLWVI